MFNLALKNAKTSLAWLIKLLKAISEKLKKGTKAVTNGIKEFFEELKKALDEIFPKWRKKGVKTGSGGFLNYKTIISRNMIKQEQEMSCAAACIKQLAADNNIKIAESVIRKISGTDYTGTSDLGIIKGLEYVFKNVEISAKTYFRKPDDAIPKILDIISKEGSFIANVMTSNGNKHTIIVDKVIGNDVYIRDPWPIEKVFSNGKNGVVAILNKESFLEVWLRGGAQQYKIK